MRDKTLKWEATEDCSGILEEDVEVNISARVDREPSLTALGSGTTPEVTIEAVRSSLLARLG